MDNLYQFKPNIFTGSNSGPIKENIYSGSGPISEDDFTAVINGLDSILQRAFDNLKSTIMINMLTGDTEKCLIFGAMFADLVELQHKYNKLLKDGEEST